MQLPLAYVRACLDKYNWRQVVDKKNKKRKSQGTNYNMKNVHFSGPFFGMIFLSAVPYFRLPMVICLDFKFFFLLILKTLLHTILFIYFLAYSLWIITKSTMGFHELIISYICNLLIFWFILMFFSKIKFIVVVLE